jgi:hypothetical protein
MHNTSKQGERIPRENSRVTMILEIEETSTLEKCRKMMELERSSTKFTTHHCNRRNLSEGSRSGEHLPFALWDPRSYSFLIAGKE